MKKLMIAFAAMALFASCETKVASDSSANTAAVDQENSDNTRKVYNALETGDVSGLDSLFAEDVIDHDANPAGGDIKGRDSVKAAIAQLHTMFEGLKIEMLHHATSADGSYHYSTARMTGKSTDKCPWMPPGTSMDDISVDVIKLKDGKCTDHWSFMSMKDMNEMMAAMMKGGEKPAEKK
jgi:ketosteroid isomerase-like protein